jgi:hypothetical protein
LFCFDTVSENFPAGAWAAQWRSHHCDTCFVPACFALLGRRLISMEMRLALSVGFPTHDPGILL